jgi:DNA-binding response OmpR family regulator
MSEKTILVADDESHILHVVSLKLRNAGFRVLTRATGRKRSRSRSSSTRTC